MEVFENGGVFTVHQPRKCLMYRLRKTVLTDIYGKGKIAELALGYGNLGALKAMGALQVGVLEEELQPLVTARRQSNPHIVKLGGMSTRQQ